MNAQENNEFHELIDDIAKDKFFGEVTFYFQNGNIESARKSERYTKNELKEIQERKRRRVVISRPSAAVGNA